MSVEVSAPGAARLARDLARAADQLDDAALTRRVGEPIARRAEATAPRRTGTLARSISVTKDGVVVDAAHAIFVHAGTRHMPGRPFLTRAIDEAEAIRIADQYLADVLGPIESNTYV